MSYDENPSLCCHLQIP